MSGKCVAGLCSLNLEKCTLELGGSRPFIIFDDADLDDADLDDALTRFMALKWRNGGQVCISVNRVYV